MNADNNVTPSATNEPAALRKSRRLDAAVAIALGIAAALGCWYTSGIAKPVYQTNDFWFDSDNRTILTLLSDRWAAQHHRSAKHPLFALAEFPAVQIVHRVAGIDIADSVRAFNCLTAAAWIAVMYWLLRAIGLHRLDGVVYSALAATTAAAVFWFSVVETFPLGSLSILLMLLIVAVDQVKPISSWWFVIGSAATLSITVTNWMAGWISAALRFPPRQAIQITVNGFCIVAVLFGLQKYLTPRAEYFIGDRKAREFVLREEAGGPMAISRAFFVHSVIAPRVTQVDPEQSDDKQLLTIQRCGIGSSGKVGLACSVGWLALLGVGAYAMVMKPANDRFRNVLGLTILGQLALHLVFGTETFLYTLHFAPLLVIMASGASFTRIRCPMLAVAIALTIALGISNLRQLQRAVSLLDSSAASSESASASGLTDPTDIPQTPVVAAADG